MSRRTVTAEVEATTKKDAIEFTLNDLDRSNYIEARLENLTEILGDHAASTFLDPIVGLDPPEG